MSCIRNAGSVKSAEPAFPPFCPNHSIKDAIFAYFFRKLAKMRRWEGARNHFLPFPAWQVFLDQPNVFIDTREN